MIRSSRPTASGSTVASWPSGCWKSTRGPCAVPEAIAVTVGLAIGLSRSAWARAVSSAARAARTCALPRTASRTPCSSVIGGWAWSATAAIGTAQTRTIMDPNAPRNLPGELRHERVQEKGEVAGGTVGTETEANERGDLPGMLKRQYHRFASIDAAIGISVRLKRLSIEVKWKVVFGTVGDDSDGYPGAAPFFDDRGGRRRFRVDRDSARRPSHLALFGRGTDHARSRGDTSTDTARSDHGYVRDRLQKRAIRPESHAPRTGGDLFANGNVARAEARFQSAGEAHDEHRTHRPQQVERCRRVAARTFQSGSDTIGHHAAKLRRDRFGVFEGPIAWRDRSPFKLFAEILRLIRKRIENDGRRRHSQ